ncbi:MAG: beta-ketoacyl synthase N-terminal-like domain-containing protein [Planctomycetota bacterium]
MRPVITGISKISSSNIGRALMKLNDAIKQMRFINGLEQLAIISMGIILDNARISVPVGNANIGLFVGIDDSIEDLKDEYFNGILNDGILGASPLHFPFTTPNSLAAQVSIAFDIRGESITIPVKRSYRNVIEYAHECITERHTKMAIAGGILLNDKRLSIEEGRYMAEFFFLEDAGSAAERGVTVYNHTWEEAYETL